MRNLTLLFLFITSFSFSQNLDNCGLDDNPLLNNDEASLLNEYFKDTKGDFDFTGKKILIVSGSGGSGLDGKKQYFKEIKDWKINNHHIASWIYPFTAEEKNESGGYDVAVSFWSKVGVNKKKVIRKIKNGKWVVPGTR